MKKLSLVLTTAFFCYSQLNAQVKLGVTAGVTVCTPKISGFTDINNFSTPVFGIITQIDLGQIAFRPSLNYLRNGYKTEIATLNLPGLSSSEYREVIINNIEIPLDIMLPVKMNKGQLLLSFAPTVTLGLNGKYTISQYLNGNNTATVKSDVEFGEDASEIKKIDWGSRIGVGYEFKNGLQLNGAYKIGLSNQSNQNNQTYKNHYLALTAAWYLFK